MEGDVQGAGAHRRVPADRVALRQETLQRLTVIANLRAEAANPQWVGDVRSRKLCCANGSGSVHGIFYTLQDQFGIGLTRYSP